MIKEAGEIIVWTLSCFIVFVSLLPLIKSDKWYIRIFDYPRWQKFWINLGLLIALVLITADRTTAFWILAGALGVNQLYLFLLIRPYTPLAARQMKENESASGERVKLFVANVYQDNHDTARFLSMVNTESPDIILLVETDQWWAQATRPLTERYPHHVSIPLPNTYGMMLFSRIRLVNYEVRYLVDPEIPSIKADMETQEGFRFRLYALHPKPPVPTEADESTERDAEILIVGKESKQCDMPVIVAGDLNDVAWSYTTRLFLKVSELLDPRIGRGFYSTFHAHYPLMRWPLDHIFCSSHFLLISLRRMPHIGSDHFPMLLEVAMMPYENEENTEHEKQASTDDMQSANEKITKAATDISK